MSATMNYRIHPMPVVLAVAFRRMLKTGTVLGATLAVAGLAHAAPAVGTCAGQQCPSQLRGKVLDNSTTGHATIGENTEKESLADQGEIPFSISVDGEVVDESGRPRPAVLGSDPSAKPVDKQRKADVDLSAVDIQLKFDGLGVRTQLNISTMPIRRAYKPGEVVHFRTSSNYPAFVDHAEIRIRGAFETDAAEPIAVIPVALNSEGSWTMPAGEVHDFSYVLRVYDSKGRFDQTEPLSLLRSDSAFIPAARTPAAAPGVAEDRTAFRNIPVYGGAVTAFGRNVPAGYQVEAFNEVVPLDPHQSFVVQRILPPGDRKVDVSVKGASKSGGLRFSRDINIPQNDWFYVALADLTVGKKFADNNIEMVRDGDYDRIYTKGRLAFYLKGKIKGKYILTAAADTGEDDVRNLFRGMDSKDPDQVLKRIDPEEYYPVYGDDSTMIEDAPTSGKFYVRLERGDSHVMWGNYKTEVTGSTFINSARSLYGANAAYRSEDVTSFGARKTEVSGYLAQPETIPQRDQFLATGGSAYFLKRQDITIGSETVTVEVRNSVTGTVIQTNRLTSGDDYSIDYTQGLILLKHALSSATATTDAVRSSALGGVDVYLIAQYEYTPLASEIDGYAHGARAQQWLGDKVRVGVSEMTDNTGENNYQAVGTDIQLRHSATTFAEAEVARSRGSGFSTSTSTDGGLSISDGASGGSLTDHADAWRLRGQLDLADIPGSKFKGTVGGHYERRGKGFSTESEQLTAEKETWGLQGQVALTDKTDVKLAHDQLQDGDGRSQLETSVNLGTQVTDKVKVTTGLSHSELASRTALEAGKSGQNGERVDGGVRVDYQVDDGHMVYAFGQGTLKTSGDIHRNDRGGVGTKVQLTEKVSANGELSEGTSGIGVQAGLDYQPTADDTYSVGYRLDPDRADSLTTENELSGSDKGTIVFGARKKMTETASTYSESNLDLYGLRQSLAQTYGVVYTPDANWTVDSSIQTGSIRDTTIDPDTGKERSDFERQAAAVSLGYSDDDLGLKGHLRGEFRHENSQDDTRDLNSYLLAYAASIKLNDNWRALSDLDVVLSQSASSVYNEGDYIKTNFAYAYRPFDNDRFNALFRYTYLYDVPGGDQVTSSTESGEPLQQRSHILSADLSYDLYPWLTVGTKQGLRIGEVRGGDFSSDWQRSTAYLGTLRTDFHVVKNWDALLETRVLYMPQAETADFGALAAVYRHVGEHMKIGAGYNFGRFSDDLTDLTLDDQGLFLNVVGKY
ncbi:TonB-dependent receptor [Rhizobium halophytocola]|uniref:TonB-dependent receptor n=1 Tax=Rhizobium halophytocola TaxID=735519 RepID=A0ABS4DU77_9HYPH|nr:TonB-dependent receptor [Rhizobium halophytocola]MBP1849235.1 hypothetical protein [Rhizobium halophytocola]